MSSFITEILLVLVGIVAVGFGYKAGDVIGERRGRRGEREVIDAENSLEEYRRADAADKAVRDIDPDATPDDVFRGNDGRWD